MTRIAENTPRTIAVALGVWALAAAAGSASIAARFHAGEIAGLALLAFVFATATAFLDRGVRSCLAQVPTSTLASWTVAGNAIVLAGWYGLARADAASIVAPIASLEAFAALFAAPVAGAVLVVLALRLGSRAAISSPAMKAPAARPAVS